MVKVFCDLVVLLMIRCLDSTILLLCSFAGLWLQWRRLWGSRYFLTLLTFVAVSYCQSWSHFSL